MRFEVKALQVPAPGGPGVALPTPGAWFIRRPAPFGSDLSFKKPVMSARSFSTSPKPNKLMRCKARPLLFDNKSASSLQVRPLSLPVRVAVVGNHFPRQCGIATFTTDLCDAIAGDCGDGGVSVIAVNDPQSQYKYPSRVQCEVTERQQADSSMSELLFPAPIGRSTCSITAKKRGECARSPLTLNN